MAKVEKEAEMLLKACDVRRVGVTSAINKTQHSALIHYKLQKAFLSLCL